MADERNFRVKFFSDKKDKDHGGADDEKNVKATQVVVYEGFLIFRSGTEGVPTENVVAMYNAANVMSVETW